MSLIEDAKNKNPDAFEQLIQPQLQRMYRVAISMLHNEEDAADAIQKTVLKCWQKIGQLKSEEYFGTWLTRILINQCKDILKERKKVVPLEEFPELIHEDHYFTNEWRKILSNLNGKYQIVMELYYVDGFSTKEIARMLHITEVNVRSRMVRGRKQLEQILTVIDFQIKVDYCRQRIEDEIERGIRSDWPYIEYVERERIITLDSDVKVDDEILSQQWLKAYEDILREYYRENSTYYENPERYYANVCFIYLNDDEIPEMLFSHGCTDLDYDDRCNLRNYLYTYKNGEAVLLTPGVETIDDFYGYNKPFSYVERKGMVYCDYYIYDFTTYNSETDMIDNVNDHMSKMDVWDLDTLTCTSSNANIEMLHAIYNYVEEEYADATFNVEYYVNVSDIIRDENTGYVKEIIGEKVDRQTYEKSEASLWSGEQITTLSISDYDKIYADDNLLEALAQCYLKNRM